jgi:hypothetical protein
MHPSPERQASIRIDRRRVHDRTNPHARVRAITGERHAGRPSTQPARRSIAPDRLSKGVEPAPGSSWNAGPHSSIGRIGADLNVPHESRAAACR